jgi:putative two-component system response regulator
MSKKCLLIVDDLEIDRTVLKNILCNDFDVLEADNGYTAIQVITSKRDQLDGILLDIYMPVLDGFHVLELLADHGITDIPIIIITAESTQINVRKTASYNVSDFICKPYDADEILHRLRNMFQVKQAEKKKEEPKKHAEADVDLDEAETSIYISKLESIYKAYMDNFHIKDDHYRRVSNVMRILLMEYAQGAGDEQLDRQHIDIASKAAYFYDIGRMGVLYTTKGDSQKPASRVGEDHTQIGARIVSLNSAIACQYFTKVCADICMYHHERYDGFGYPRMLKKDEIPLFAQVCGVAARFDRLFEKRPELNDVQFEFVLHEMAVDAGEFSPEMLQLLIKCEEKLITYYKFHFNTNGRE